MGMIFRCVILLRKYLSKAFTDEGSNGRKMLTQNDFTYACKYLLGYVSEGFDR